MAKKIDIEFNKNEDGMKLAVSEMKRRFAIIEKGGGEKALAKQHEKGKLSLKVIKK
jgi:acetyl-CoA carboxylase carboxyltransferase component